MLSILVNIPSPGVRLPGCASYEIDYVIKYPKSNEEINLKSMQETLNLSPTSESMSDDSNNPMVDVV